MSTDNNNDNIPIDAALIEAAVVQSQSLKRHHNNHHQSGDLSVEGDRERDELDMLDEEHQHHHRGQQQQQEEEEEGGGDEEEEELQPKKKARTSLNGASASGGGAGMGMGEGGKVSRRVQSCQNCRLKKMRCSRTFPCGSCKMRGEECIWLGPPPHGPADSDELAASNFQVDKLRKVVQLLREKLQQQNPDAAALHAAALHARSGDAGAAAGVDVA
ncbi:hypothetical protein T439DRAFT_330256 [Meredithblackwellia eburnea MCA 4105]